MAKRAGADEAFETFGFSLPDAREREALGVLRAYLRRVERELGRRWLGAMARGREAAMVTTAVQFATLRESVQGAASFCDGLLEAAEPPSVATGHPPGGGGAGRAP